MKISLKDIIVRPERGRKDFTGIEELAASLKKYGQMQSIVVVGVKDSPGKYYLIAGERRFRAALLAGMTHLEGIDFKELPLWMQTEMEYEENVQRRDLSWQEQVELTRKAYEEKKKSGIDMRKMAEAEGVALSTIATDIALATKLNLRPELRERVGHLPKTAAKQMIERIEQAEKVNDQIERGVIQATTDLINLPCEEGIKKLPDNSVDLWLTDPPYGLENIEALVESGSHKMVQYGMMSKDHNMTLDRILSLLTKLGPEVGRVLKEGSHAYIFCGFQYVGDFIKALEPHLKFQPPLLIWKRPKPSAPGYGYNYLSYAEAIIYMYKPGEKRRRLNENQSNILEHPDIPRSERIYPTEKPVPLLRQLIEQSTIKNDVVLDTFAGSASALVAARRTGRKGIGFEKDKESWARAQDRLRAELSGVSI